MATITFDGNEDSIAQCRLIVEALTEWLSEQTETPASGRVQFCYHPDGSLDSVLTLPVSDE